MDCLDERVIIEFCVKNMGDIVEGGQYQIFTKKGTHGVIATVVYKNGASFGVLIDGGFITDTWEIDNFVGNNPLKLLPLSYPIDARRIKLS